MHNPYVIHAFAGIRIVVVALVLSAVVELWKKGVHGKFGVFIFAASMALLIFFNLSPIAVILIASVVGLVYLKWVRK